MANRYKGPPSEMTYDECWKACYDATPDDKKRYLMLTGWIDLDRGHVASVGAAGGGLSVEAGSFPKAFAKLVTAYKERLLR